jgi:hypothetical protein
MRPFSKMDIYKCPKSICGGQTWKNPWILGFLDFHIFNKKLKYI